MTEQKEQDVISAFVSRFHRGRNKELIRHHAVEVINPRGFVPKIGHFKRQRSLDFVPDAARSCVQKSLQHFPFDQAPSWPLWISKVKSIFHATCKSCLWVEQLKNFFICLI